MSKIISVKTQPPTRTDKDGDGFEDLEKDKIPGGIGDKKDIKDFCPKQVAMGIRVELEHTSDKAIAEDIVKDHLTEDPMHYTKLKEVEKSELQERWDLIKAKLDSSKSILDMKEAMQPEQEEEGQDDQIPQDDSEPDIQDSDEVPEADAGQEEPPAAGEEPPPGEQPQEEGLDPQDGEQPPQDGEQPPQDGEDQEDPQELFKDEMLQMQMQNQGYSQAQIDYILHGHIPASASSEDIKAEADKAMSELKQQTAKNDQTQESQHRQELHDQNKTQRDQSHDAKHEHQSKMDELKYMKDRLDLEREKADDGLLSDKHHKHLSAEQDRVHGQRMKDLEYETAKKDHGGSDIDLEHKKKLLEIEYEKSKKEAELEIKFKEEEYKVKLQQMKQSHNDKTVHTQEQHKSKMAMQAETGKAKMVDHKENLRTKSAEKKDAAKTSKAEIKGKDKT